MAAFASNLGQGAPQLIAQAMAQRGMTPQSSPISQVSPSSPSFSPSTAVPPPLPMPQGGGFPPHPVMNPTPSLPPHPVMNQQPQITLPVNDANKQKSGIQVPISEAQMIIKALTSRLGILGKQETMQPQENIVRPMPM